MSFLCELYLNKGLNRKMIFLMVPHIGEFDICKKMSKDYYKTYCGCSLSDQSEKRARKNKHLISLNKICKRCLEKIGRDITFDLINYKLGVK